jgi:hypothetical protein
MNTSPDDVGVANATGGFGLENELLDALGLFGETIVQNLDGHWLLEHDVLGAIDDAHSPLADHTLDHVILEPHADSGHDLRCEQGLAILGAQRKCPGEATTAVAAHLDGAHVYDLVFGKSIAERERKRRG